MMREEQPPPPELSPDALKVRLTLRGDGSIHGDGGWVVNSRGWGYRIEWVLPPLGRIGFHRYEQLVKVARAGGWLIYQGDDVIPWPTPAPCVFAESDLPEEFHHLLLPESQRGGRGLNPHPEDFMNSPGHVWPPACCVDDPQAPWQQPAQHDSSLDDWARRLADMYRDILDFDPQAYDLFDLVLGDRTRIEGLARYATLTAEVDAFWRAHPEAFNTAMRTWHNREMRAVYGITDRRLWWWWPLPDGGKGRED